MKVKTKATVLTAESKPYSFEGREGVSSKVRVLVDGDIIPLKATEAQVVEATLLLGKKGEVEFDITSRKENVQLLYVGFTS